jgi:hypothetical protein
MSVFWVVAPCRLVLVYRRFGGLYCLRHEDDEGATTQKTAFFILTAVRTSYHKLRKVEELPCCENRLHHQYAMRIKQRDSFFIVKLYFNNFLYVF